MKTKRNYLFNTLMVGVCLSFNSCISNPALSTSEEKNTEKSEKEIVYVPNYRLIRENPSSGFIDKIEYVVQIYDELDKEQLELVAKNIYSIKRPKYDLIFISYYLPSQQVGTGSWGLTEIRNRYFMTQVHGVPTKKIPQTSITDSDTKILGKWINHIIGGEYLIYEKNNKFFFKCSFSDGSKSESELIKRHINGITRYYEKVDGEPSEYYVIKDGSLYMYDVSDNLGGIYHP